MESAESGPRQFQSRLDIDDEPNPILYIQRGLLSTRPGHEGRDERGMIEDRPAAPAATLPGREVQAERWDGMH